MNKSKLVENTLPRLLKESYEKYGDRVVVMRDKKFGIWQEYTWQDYYENVKYFSLGLIALGMQTGDKVAILGDNKPQAYWAELAAQSSLGTAVGIYTDCMPQEVKFYLEHSDAKFVVCGDQEQVDKLLDIKDELPLLKKVIYWDPKGVWNYKDTILASFNSIIEMGQSFDLEHPGLFEKNLESGNPDDIAVFCYTSGTTGQPKAAMISHRTLIANAKSISDIDNYRPGEEVVSFVPLAWSTDQYLGIAGPLTSGIVVNFPEDPDTVQENIREIGPQILFWGPRNWESVNRLIQAKLIDTSSLKRSLHNFFLPFGYNVSDARMVGKKPRIHWVILNFIGEWLVFRNLRDKVGLANVRVATTAGSAISPDIIRYFHAIGVPIKQLYGGTEHGLVTLARTGDIVPEATGQPSMNMDVRIAEDGEMLIRGGCIFSGYYKNEEAYHKTVKDGWMLTGDFGHIMDGGHVVVMDRMSDLRDLQGGRKFSPQFAEIRLRFSPYLKDVLTIGGAERAFVTCIVNIDLDNVGRWAEAKRIPYTTFTDLSQKHEVIELISKDIQKVNRALPEWARIKKFVNLHREFDADEAELTRTRKIKRNIVEERYSDLIAALYSDATELSVEAPVTYRDGRKGTIKTALKINFID